MTPAQHNRKLKNLPDFLKDFHDQKELFKSMQDFYQDNESFKKLPNSWVDNQVYMIDFFLWFMGLHGWKLQKDRTKGVDFYNIEDTLTEARKQREDAFSKIFSTKEETEL